MLTKIIVEAAFKKVGHPYYLTVVIPYSECREGDRESTYSELNFRSRDMGVLCFLDYYNITKTIGYLTLFLFICVTI